jgi:hypothetical protein
MRVKLQDCTSWYLYCQRHTFNIGKILKYIQKTDNEKKKLKFLLNSGQSDYSFKKYFVWLQSDRENSAERGLSQQEMPSEVQLKNQVD